MLDNSENDLPIVNCNVSVNAAISVKSLAKPITTERISDTTVVSVFNSFGLFTKTDK